MSAATTIPDSDVRQFTRRLALGTVQFGLQYGIANRTGQVSRDDAAAILELGRRSGLDTLDTAIGYGESERRLGEIGVTDWRVITKLPRVPEGCADVGAWVRESVDGSLSRLGVTRLGGLLLHQSQGLLGPNGLALYDAMSALKMEGVVSEIGVSIYAPADLDALVPRFRLDLVQAPFNLIDRRLATSGWLARLHDAGTEVHVRSLFLQGLLLMDDGDRPERFARWAPLWREWRNWLREENMSPLQACLWFALSRPEISRLVVGADTVKQLQEIIASAHPRGQVPAAPTSLMSEDIDLINPLHWITS